MKYIFLLVSRNAVFIIDSRSSPFRALSVPPPPISIPPRSLSVSPRDIRATSVPPLYNSPLSPLDILSEYEREPFQRALSPTPIKCGRWAPRSNEVAFDSDGNLSVLFCNTGQSIFGIISIILFSHLLKSFHISKNRFHENKKCLRARIIIYHFCLIFERLSNVNFSVHLFRCHFVKVCRKKMV